MKRFYAYYSGAWTQSSNIHAGKAKCYYEYKCVNSFRTVTFMIFRIHIKDMKLKSVRLLSYSLYVVWSHQYTRR